MSVTRRIAIGRRFGKKSQKWTPGKVRHRKRVRCLLTGRKIAIVTKKE